MKISHDDFKSKLTEIFRRKGTDTGGIKILMKWKIRDRGFVYFVKGVTQLGLFNNPFNPVRVQGNIRIHNENELRIKLTAYSIMNLYATTVGIVLLLITSILVTNENIPFTMLLFELIGLSIAFIIYRNYSLKSINRAMQIFTLNFHDFQYIGKVYGKDFNMYEGN